MRNNVSFGHIHIREHPVVLGDHPGVSSGPALSLGWFEDDDTMKGLQQQQDQDQDDGTAEASASLATGDHNVTTTNNNNNKITGISREFQICLDEYERDKQQPRTRQEMVVPRGERQRRILQAEMGVTMNDIRQAQIETDKIKRAG